MTGALSDYLETKFLDHLLRSATWSKPGAIWISLHTEDPYDTGLGTEVSGGSYARQQLNPSDANWSEEGPYPYTAGQSRNLVAVTFPSPTADWGVVRNFGLWDASSSGHLLIRGSITAPLNVVNGGAAPNFPIGSLLITVA